MRYFVGELVPIITFIVRHNDDPRGYDAPEVNSISFAPDEVFIRGTIIKIAKCIEHRKVRNVFAPENAVADCDGFIFKAGREVLHNQYPVASYGKYDKQADFIFNRVAKCKPYHTYISLATYLENLLHCISKFDEAIKNTDDGEYSIFASKKKASLEKHYRQVVILFQTGGTGLVIKVEDVEVGGVKQDHQFKVSFV
jgi:hypothetical protein